jgi:hypothetical protein
VSARQWLSDRPPPSHARLCVMTHYVLDRLGDDAMPSDVVDELKWECARAGFAYPSPRRLTAAAAAVAVARQKGYSTPRAPRVVRRRA